MNRIIDATWNRPSSYLTIMPGGVLYFCVGLEVNTPTRVYKSTDYGQNFVLLYEGNLALFSIAVTSAGYIATTAPYTQGIQYTQDFISFTTKLCGGKTVYSANGSVWCNPIMPSHVWVAGFTSGIDASRDVIALSKDGGITFNACNNAIAFNGLTNHLGRIKVNDAMTVGIVGNSGSNAGTDPRRSTSPTANGANGQILWTTFGGGSTRGMRPGIDFPKIVIAPRFGNNFYYSVDSGANFAAKLLPVDMRMPVGDDGYLDLTLNGDTVLAHLCVCNTPGIYRSTDFGNSWVRVNDPLSPADTNGASRSGVQFDPFSPSHVYAWGKNGFYTSTDSGVTFTLSGIYLPTVTTGAAVVS